MIFFFQLIIHLCVTTGCSSSRYVQFCICRRMIGNKQREVREVERCRRNIYRYQEKLDVLLQIRHRIVTIQIRRIAGHLLQICHQVMKNQIRRIACHLILLLKLMRSVHRIKFSVTKNISTTVLHSKKKFRNPTSF